MKQIQRKQFTLIELLVVIAIIGILAGLVFPAVGAVRDKGKMSRAQTECQNLKVAIANYETEFACWPAKTSGNDALVSSSEYAAMCRALAGTNSRKMVFFEPNSNYKESEGFLDPWGNPYQVILDANFDNKLDKSVFNGAADLKENYLFQRIAVFSYGMKEANISEAKKKGKLVSSWK